MTNIMVFPLAYRAAVVSIMLTQFNWIAERLDLPCGHHIAPAGLTSAFVPDPRVIRPPPPPDLPDGTITAAGYWMSFINGKLFMISNRGTNMESVDRYAEWGKTASLIGTNEARLLAEKWLHAIGIDVIALNRRYPVHVHHPSYHPGGIGEFVRLPLFYVHWTDQDDRRPVGDFPNTDGVLVGVFGPTKTMTGLSLNDQSFCTITNLVLTNEQALLNTPNPEAIEIGTNSPLWKPATNAAEEGPTKRAGERGTPNPSAGAESQTYDSNYVETLATSLACPRARYADLCRSDRIRADATDITSTKRGNPPSQRPRRTSGGLILAGLGSTPRRLLEAHSTRCSNRRNASVNCGDKVRKTNG